MTDKDRVDELKSHGRQAYNKALEVINTQRIKSDQQRELLTIIATEVETECTCDASRDKCLHCRIVLCLEGKV